MAKEYPSAPVVGVGGVVVRGDRALIVKRAHEPRRGEWSIPGGAVELGERLTDAVRRELREETGLDVDVGEVVELFDRIHRDGDGRVRYHFVIVDFLCHAPTGDAAAGTDADAVAWVTAEELDTYGVNQHAAAVIRKALSSQP
jgi:ADP-ribose pyrophosphatase YjhB (NUDIX family)